MSQLEQLLQEFAQGRLSLEQARAHLQGMDAAHLQAHVSSALRAGRLTDAQARALLGTLSDFTERTELSTGDTQLQPDLTQLRPTTDATQKMPAADAAQPHQARIEPTMVRPGDQMQDDATSVRAGAAVSATPAQPHPHTAAVPTLKMPVEEHAPYTATLRVDKTQVIAGRLVESLDDESVRGPLQPGSVIKKRFVLESLIGKGGMGLVFGAIDRRKEEARDPNPRVALKVLNADFQRHPQSFMALQREARKAQTLAHPNVVTVFDFDRDGDSVYMTMELLKGRSLDSMVREVRGKGLEKSVALSIVRGIAEGLAYAHRKGIVHSDLKPGNVFITEDGTPKILDFGIARAVPGAMAEDNKDVFDAGSLGAYTEAYATDEMVEGVDPHPADDLYALGIIGYELLTGFHPYQRHGAREARKLGIKPPPLKGMRRKETRALQRCLSFERSERPKDAGEFLKLFRGVSTLQRVSIAAAAVLAAAAGYLSYQNYQATSPAIPFSDLPAATQQQFTQLMRNGDREWQFYEQGIQPALAAAVEEYSKAYDLHPRNRDAVKALNKSAAAYLELAGANPELRKEAAENLLRQSEYFRKYNPVVEAAK